VHEAARTEERNIQWCSPYHLTREACQRRAPAGRLIRGGVPRHVENELAIEGSQVRRIGHGQVLPDAVPSLRRRRASRGQSLQSNRAWRKYAAVAPGSAHFVIWVFARVLPKPGTTAGCAIGPALEKVWYVAYPNSVVVVRHGWSSTSIAPPVTLPATFMPRIQSRRALPRCSLALPLIAGGSQTSMPVFSFLPECAGLRTPNQDQINPCCGVRYGLGRTELDDVGSPCG
jgi:hypothetical protein